MSLLQTRIEQLREQYTKNYQASRALTSDLDVPAPSGLHYLPYQKAGIAYAIQNDGVLLADEPGLGKTIQALGLINYDASIKNILIVCPASLKENWLQECYTWLTRNLSIAVAQGFFPPTNIVIVNYDVLERHIEVIRAKTFDLIVVDEAHNLRNANSIKASLIIGNPAKNIPCINARKKLFLTGTPIVNRPSELWPLLHYLNPKAWTSWDKFAARFCRETRNSRKKSKQHSGASELEELQKMLRASLMVRRMKREVLHQLPKKLRRIFKVSDEHTRLLVQKENKMHEIHQSNIAALRNAVLIAKESKEKDRQTYINAIAKFKEGRRVAMADYSRMRHQAALLKLPHVIKHVESILLQEPNKKLVIFAHHSDVIAHLLTTYGHRAVAVSGATPNRERQEAVKKFQRDEQCRIFIGSISASGTGFTLTASHHVIFAEICYVSADLCQAEDRVHRIGQQHDVFVDHVLLDESIEIQMAQIVIEKQRISDEALDYNLN